MRGMCGRPEGERRRPNNVKYDCVSWDAAARERPRTGLQRRHLLENL
eukprot:COSAG04_NODE_11394_length_711_cov_1.893791_1_plen_46_part_10